jgi:drug/metabolite transporter (DMT)-like permease
MPARLAPILFVFLWSTGWLVAGVTAREGADPLTFLALRFGAAFALMVPVLLWMGAPFPRSPAAIVHAIISGLLIHGFYLGAVWWAVGQGVPAGISALIAALQPLMTAALGPTLIGEHLSRRQWLGIGIGLAGIGLVLAPRLAGVSAADLGRAALPLGINVLGMLAVTLGSFHQKRFLSGADLPGVTAVQYAGALAFVLPLALLLEPMRLPFTPAMAAVLAWSVLGLSFLAVGLFYWLIRQGAVAKAASLIYLVPPTAAVQAWLILGETLTAGQIAGMAITGLGVALVSAR